MADYSFLSKSDRFKRLQADFQHSLLTDDDSRFFPESKAVDPRRFGDISLVTRTRIHQRLIEREKLLAAAGITIVFDESLDAFVWQKTPTCALSLNNVALVHSVASDRQSKRDAKQKLQNCATVAGGDGSAIFHFLAKNRQSLPVVFVQNEKNSCFLASTRNTPENAKSLGFCNTQTNGGVPPKITINRSDFLTR